MISIDSETCYYCDQKSEYWDMAGVVIVSVCKKHFKTEPSS